MSAGKVKAALLRSPLVMVGRASRLSSQSAGSSSTSLASQSFAQPSVSASTSCCSPSGPVTACLAVHLQPWSGAGSSAWWQASSTSASSGTSGRSSCVASGLRVQPACPRMNMNALLCACVAPRGCPPRSHCSQALRSVSRAALSCPSARCLAKVTSFLAAPSLPAASCESEVLHQCWACWVLVPVVKSFAIPPAR